MVEEGRVYNENNFRFGEIRARIDERLDDLRERLIEANGDRKLIEGKIGVLVARNKRISGWFYEMNKPLLHNYAIKVGELYPYLNAEDVFDELQDAFFNAIRKWIPGGGKFSTYAVNAMDNRLKNMLRHHYGNSTCSIDDQFDDRSDYKDNIPNRGARTPLSLAIRKEEIAMMMEGLERLPETQRLLMRRELHYGAGHGSQLKAAKDLGISRRKSWSLRGKLN